MAAALATLVASAAHVGKVTRVVPGPDGVVHLPANVTLQEIHVSGHDLVVDLPDGSKILIVNGAVVPPQIDIGDIQVPTENLAALLQNTNQVQPAAGPPGSSGGDFSVPVGNIGQGLGITGLLPPTELAFGTITFTQANAAANQLPSVDVEVPGGPVGGVANAVESVNESGLPQGSNPGVGLTASGTIVYTPGDQPAVLAINGVAVTGVGQTIQGADGVLSITSISGTTVGYTYTLNTVTSGDNVTDPFTVTVTDATGDVAAATLTIDIVDDVPLARPDTDALAAGAYGPKSGNVMTGAGTTSGGTGADTQGADGAHVTSVQGAGAAATVGAAGVTVVGTYGDLTINQDGSYTYTRHAGTPGGVSDVFRYTLTDGDGDTSSTTLTVSLGNASPTLTLPTEGGAGALVNEAGLATGSNPGSSSVTAGTISYTPGDGPDTVTVGGAAVTAVGQVIHGTHGDITITSIAAGAIGYTYTLTNPVTEAAANNGADTVPAGDSFAVTVTDQDGSTASGTLKVDIVDDTPTAHADTNSVAGASYGPVTGNVETNDTKGADGAHVSAAQGAGASAAVGAGGVTVTGTYGDLTIQQDGSYSYVRHAGTPGGVSDVFNYTLTDGDGDTSTTTLTIAIGNAIPTLTLPTEGAAGALVNEAGLATGSNPGPSHVTNGTISYTPGDGPDTVTVGGTAVTAVGQVIHGTHGDIQITSIAAGSIGYSYTLTTPVNEATSNNGADTVAPGDSFAVVVTDSDGSTASGTLKVDIIDDVPTAHADSGNVAAGTYGPVVGNVETNDTLGADGAHVSSAQGAGADTAVAAGGVTVTGTYGDLTIQQDGSYSYVRHAGTPGGVSDVFNYTLTDGDGDTSTTTLTIAIGNATPTLTLPTEGAAGALVNEAGLATGSNPGASATTAGTISYTPGDSPDTVTVGGTAVTTVGQVIHGTHGDIQITSIAAGSIGYSYTLTTPVTESTANNGADTVAAGDSFAVVVTDSDGSTASSTLKVDIIDDTPTAHLDSGSVTEGATLTVAAGAGVLSNDVAGADGFLGGAGHGVTGVAAGTVASASGNVGTSVAGAFGTLTLNADGSYTYVSTPNAVPENGATDTFTYTVTDGDGDTSTTQLVIHLADSHLAATHDQVTVNEAGIAVIGSHAGDGSATGTGTLADNIAGGTGPYTYSLVSGANGAHGTLTLNANGTYSYTLTSPVAEAPSANNGTDTVSGADTFTYKVTDAHGNSVTNTITVNAIDDTPTAHADSGNVAEGATLTVTAGSGVLGNDVAGADGFQGGAGHGVTGVAAGVLASTSGSVGTSVAGSFGTLTLNADGSYTYVSTPNAVPPAGATDTFSYTVTDGDGDTSTTQLVIHLSDSGLAATNDQVTVNEAGLPAIGSHAGDGSATGTGSVADNVSGGTGPYTYSLVGSATGTHGTLTLNPNGTYSYTLTSPVTEATANNGTDTVGGADTFTYKVTDAHGNSVTNTITVNAIDDVPTAHADTGNVAAGTYGPIVGNVETNDTKGADGAHVSSAQGTGADTAVAGGGVTVTGTYGDLTIQQDGSYSYVRHAGTPGGVSDVFNYTLTDGDGDTSTTTLTIAIGNAIPTLTLPTEGAAGALVNEAGLATGSNPGPSHVTNGTISYTPGDGPDTVTVGGTAVTAVGQVIHGTHGDIQITSIAAGSIGYSYTLTTPVNEATSNNGADTVAPGDSFAVVVTDSDGSTASGTLKVDIIDDVPTAHADSGNVAAGTYGPVVGNVETNDTLGADGAHVSSAQGAGADTAVAAGGVTVTGTYGDLTIQQDGSYSYVRHAGTPGGVSDVFNYTLTDGDGDTSTTTLTIAIGNATPTLTLPTEGAAGALVNEAGLATGSNPGASATTAGTISYTPGDGPDTVTVGGTAVTAVGQVIHGTHGDIQITSIAAGSIGYSYTLTTPVNEATSNNGADTVAPGDSFAVVVTDSDGSTASGTLKVDIIDDVPTAHADTGLVTEGATLTVAASGVLSNDVPGADGFAAGGGVVGVRTAGGDTTTAVTTGVNSGIAGAYGTLTLHADGSYTYQSVANSVPPAGADDTFVYTVKDGDGDLSTTTLTIHVAGTNLAAANDQVTVNEAGLAVIGSHAGDGSATGTGTVADNVTGGTGPYSFTLLSPAAGAHGTLTFNPDGTYSYSLTSPVTEPTANNGTDTVGGADTFTYQVTDSHGNTATNTITVNAIDDVPTASPDTGNVAAGTYGPIVGNVESNDTKGADGAHVSSAQGAGAVTAVPGGGTTVTGTYGDLTIQQDGSYSYVRHAGTPGGVSDVFHYTLTDGDGDTSTTTLTIAIGNAIPTLTLPTEGAAGALVNEAGLATGSNPGPSHVTNGTISYTPGDGPDTVTVGGTAVTAVGQVIHGAHGDIQITSIAAGSIGYSYTLTTPVNEATSNNGADTVAPGDSFAVVVTDSDGSTASGTLKVDIIDDVPTAHADSGNVAEGATLTVTAAAGVLSNDVAGADGFLGGAGHGVTGVAAGTLASTSGSVGTSVAGSFGTLTLNADGSYAYVSTPNLVPPAGATDTFSYTVTDGDGDKSTTQLVIHLTDSGLAATSDQVTVNEAGIAVIGSHAGDGSATGTGTVADNISGGTGPYTYSLVSSATGTHGTLTLNPNGTYSYTLTSPVTEATANNGADTINGADTFTYQVKDANGNTVTNSITINAIDDTPTAHADSGNVAEGATLTVAAGAGVLANDVPGADGFQGGAGHGVTGVAAGVQASTSGSVATSVAGSFGTLTINADGSYTYVSTPNLVPPAGATDTFSYTVTDGDGDKSTTQLVIHLSDSGLSATNDQVTVNEAGIAVIGSHAGNGTATGTGTVADNVSGGTGPFTYSLVGSATGTHGTLTLNANGTYSYTLTSPVTESPAANNGTDTVSGADTFTYKVTDANGNTVTNTITVNAIDDVPTIGTVQSQQTGSTVGSLATGTLHLTPGADGIGSVTNITYSASASAPITSGGHNIVTSFSGGVLTGYQDANNNGSYDAGTDTVKVFTLTVNPAAGTSGQYTFDLLAKLDGAIVNTPIGGSTSFGAGPAGEQILTAGVQNISIVEGFTTSGFNTSTWAGTVTQAAVNGSTPGWGVDNNVFNVGELMRFDFHEANVSTPPAGGFSGPLIGYADFKLPGFSTSDTIFVKVVYENADGSAAGSSIMQLTSAQITAANSSAGLQLSAPIGTYIDYIDFYDTSGNGKVSLIAAGTQSTVVNETLTFTTSVSDGDGDVATSGAFTVHVADGLAPFALAAPVVIDLNGDGAQFLSQAAGVTFNYGSGLVSTAWAAPQDGILALDNGGKLVISFSQFVQGATSDLQGLTAFDSNHDGVLSAADAPFSSFGVWVDANSNGVVDAGEFKTLAQMGITSINLTSDGKSYVAAGGDVSVAGTTTVTYANGQTTTAADAAFATSQAPATTGSSSMPSTGRTVDAGRGYLPPGSGLAASLVAAGLVAGIDHGHAAAAQPHAAALVADTTPTPTLAGPVTAPVSEGPNLGEHVASLLSEPVSPVTTAPAGAAHAFSGAELSAETSLAGSPLASGLTSPGALTSGGGGGLPLISQGIDMRGLAAMDGTAGGKFAAGAAPSLSSQGLPAANVQAVAKILADALHTGDAAHDLGALVSGGQGAGVATLAAGPAHAGGDALAASSAMFAFSGGGGDAAHILSTMMAHAAATHAHV
ncbi:Ig-like domain-containing protein [Caulobacter sp. KR2-114]|uniref:Ig-like domain-containing protein n=1 Tax=Caulobacter sp. KR2-114 TaxID=3400912 RepID=UPI003C0D5BE4